MSNPYQISPEVNTPTSEAPGPLGVALIGAWIVSGIANFGAVAIMLPLAATPPGTEVFAISHQLCVVLAAAVGIVLGMPFAMVALVSEPERHRKLLALAAVITCLSPVLVGNITMNLLAKFIGFTLD